jgi:hypothetical protein
MSAKGDLPLLVVASGSFDDSVSTGAAPIGCACDCENRQGKPTTANSMSSAAPVIPVDKGHDRH